MAENLEVPCFRYSGSDFVCRLEVMREEGTGPLVRCPVRRRTFALTPEERVRQALIWFLIEGADSATAWRQQLRFEVERSSLDVSAFYAGEAVEPRFSPGVPVVIFETKRQEIGSGEDTGTEEQLRNYMVRAGCRAGLTFNGRQAAWFSLAGEFSDPAWTKEDLTDLSQAESRISREAEKAAAHVAECRREFTKAADGDFDSLSKLVSLFGRDAGLTFSLSVRSKGSVGSVRAFSLQALRQDLITFRARGVVSRNRQQLVKQDFHSLHAIQPL